MGSETSEARRAITTAKRLERLPATAAAVREGSLVGAAGRVDRRCGDVNPGAEANVLAAAGEGLMPLKDACVRRTRAVGRSEGACGAAACARGGCRIWTAQRRHGRRPLPRSTPEVGGRLKSAIDDETQRIFRSRRKSGPHESHEAYAADALAELVLGDGNREGQRGHDARRDRPHRTGARQRARG